MAQPFRQPPPRSPKLPRMVWMLSTHAVPADVAALRAVLDGRLVLPGDETWDADRQAWNLAVDQVPDDGGGARLGAEDVELSSGSRAAAACASSCRAPATTPRRSARSTARCWSAPARCAACRSTPRRRVARVEAGVLWAEVTAARRPSTASRALAGSSPDVGVVGYTLGGGLSWLGRRYGLASNRVLAIEVVTADGTPRAHRPPTTSPTCSGRCAAAAAASPPSPRSSSS